MQHIALSWPTPTPLRGCVLCDHGKGATVPPGVQCHCPAVASPHLSVPTHDARRQYGPCGPDAEYLTIKGERL